MADEHRAASEKVKNDLQELQLAYNNLDKELDEKQEVLDNYHNQLGGLSIAGDEMELKNQIRDLQEEVKQLEIEKANMQDQIDSLQHDAATLIEKDGKVARERSEERKALQDVRDFMSTAKSRILRSFKSNYVRVSKTKTKQSKGSGSRYHLGFWRSSSGGPSGGKVERCRTTQGESQETD
jgi:chromosome segregation ATPase